MRVLMINRNDAYQVSGGDTIQMMQTKTSLEKLGVEVVIGTVQNEYSEGHFDLLHIFNWEQLQPVISSLRQIVSISPPIVLSPIFWYHTGHWYADAISQKKTWKTIDKIIGTQTARDLFENWQQLKFCYGHSGRTLKKYLSIPVQILPNSNLEIGHLKKNLNLSGDFVSRCTVVPNGIIKELYDPLPSPDQVFQNEFSLESFILQVGRIQSAKNQLGLIESLYNLSIPIVFIGQPSPYEPDYVNRCNDLAKQRGNVYFVSPRSPQELAGIYRLAAVHVLPSWRETPGLVSLEAAAAGCRVVSTAIGSAQEYFGDLAWYCDPRDGKSIRRAVENALASPPSTRLRDLVLERFTWDAAAVKTLEAYHLALNQ